MQAQIAKSKTSMSANAWFQQLSVNSKATRQDFLPAIAASRIPLLLLSGWGLSGSAMLDRLLLHGHVLKCARAELAHQNRLATTGGSRVEQFQSWTATSVGRF